MADKKKKNQGVKPSSGKQKKSPKPSPSVEPAASSNGLLVTVVIVALVLAVAGIYMFAIKKPAQDTQDTIIEQAIEEDEPQVAAPKLVSDTAQLKPAPTDVSSEEEKSQPEQQATVSEETEPAQAGGAPAAGAPAGAAGLTAVPGRAVSLPEAPKVVEPLTKDQIPPRTVPAVPRTQGVTGVPSAQKYQHVTAQDLTGRRRANVPAPVTGTRPGDLTKQAYEQRLENAPEELGVDADTPLGYIALPDGGHQYIVYNEDESVARVLTISSDGSKSLREIGPEGRTISLDKDGVERNFEYTSVDDGSTQVTVTDEAGNIVEERVYNESGMLVEMTDASTDEEFTYKYQFEGGQPVSYVKLNEGGAEVQSGAIGEVPELQLNAMRFNTTAPVKSYTYIRDENDLISMVVENQGEPDEVIRRYDRDGRLVELEKKKTGVTYEYIYDENDIITQITVIDKDGTTKVLDPSDPDFGFLESETEQFDPIEFSRSILEHKNMLRYQQQNLLFKRANQATQYRSLPSADQIQNLRQQPDVPTAPPGANLPVTNPAGAVGGVATPPAAAPKAPARAPARAPSAGPSVPRR